MDELWEHAMRFPVVTVPLIEGAPSIDGQVDDREWAGAALLPDFMTMSARRHEGTATRYRTSVRMQYDREALYLGFRAEYPEWVTEPVAISTKHDHTTGGESHLDLFLNPTDQWEHGEMWHLCGNANGALFERHLADAAQGMAWNPTVEYRARKTKPGWEGEFKLPFAALGVKPPTPGDLWRANLFFVRLRPGTEHSSWSPWIEWRQSQGGRGYGWLRFGTDAAAVRFEQGAQLADRVAPMVRVVGPSDAVVETSVELLRRTDEFAADNPGMIMNMARWHSERDVGGSAYIGATIGQLTKEVLGRFQPVGTPVARELKTVANENSVGLPVTPDLGEYLVRYRFVRKKGAATELLAAGALSYRVRPEMTIDIKPVLLTGKVIETTVDFSNLRDLASARQLRLQMRPAKDKASNFEQTLEIKGSEPMTFVISSEKVPPGSYVVEAAVLDASNKVLSKLDSTFECPSPPDWWTRPVGENPEVPKPWTPVKWKDGSVEVWGRQYQFTGLPVPSVVKTTPTRYSTAEVEQKPVELLAAPMTFQVSAGGKPAVLKSEPMRVVDQRPSKIVIESVNEAGDVAIKGRTTVEFDGMIRVDLEIGPGNGKEKCQIDALDFVIPFKAAHAQLLGNFKKAPGPGSDGSRYLGLLPELPWMSPVFYAQTVGTDRFGLQWMCDSTRDWRLNKPDEAVLLRRAGDRVEEVFRLIDHGVELTKPLKITFGLMALPSKPLPADWGTTRITSSLSRPPDESDEAALRDWKRWADFMKLDVAIIHNPSWSGTPWYPYYFQDQKVEAEMRRQIDRCHEHGIRYCPHSGWQAISTLIPEWATFGKEMAIAPETETIGKTVFACYNSPYSEFTAMLWEHHAKNIGIDGIKADTMFPQTPCASLYHDCGWRDHKGKLHPSINLFATREFFKRLYRIYHGTVKTNGILTAAQTGVNISPVCNFTDIVVISEGTPYHKARSLKEGYAQDLVRALMVGASYGVITIHDLKGAPLNSNQRIAALLVAGADPRFMADSGNYQRSYCKKPPGDFVYNAPCAEIWDAWDWIDRGGKAIWMPHWENARVLTLKPAATAEMYGSLYVQPGGKILLVIANYEPHAVTTDVTLDLAALGFKPGSKLHGEDAVTKSPVQVVNGSLRLGVLGERYRLVKIWDGEPARYADERLGPDRLAVGDFEDWSAAHHKIQQPRNQKEPAARADDGRALHGKTSLRLEKTEPGFHNGAGSANVELKPVTLEPGEYVVQGSVLVEETFGAPLDNGVERTPSALAGIYVTGTGIEFDPPIWASKFTGRFEVEEKTPGWDPFLIPFRVTEKAQTVTVVLSLSGVGRVWFDGVTLRKASSSP